MSIFNMDKLFPLQQTSEIPVMNSESHNTWNCCTGDYKDLRDHKILSVLVEAIQF